MLGPRIYQLASKREIPVGVALIVHPFNTTFFCQVVPSGGDGQVYFCSYAKDVFLLCLYYNPSVSSMK